MTELLAAGAIHRHKHWQWSSRDCDRPNSRDGAPCCQQARSALEPSIEEFRKQYGLAPTLAVLRVGHPPTAVSYRHSIDRAFMNALWDFKVHDLPKTPPSAATGAASASCPGRRRAWSPGAAPASEIHRREYCPSGIPCVERCGGNHSDKSRGAGAPIWESTIKLRRLALPWHSSHYAIPLDGRRARCHWPFEHCRKPMALLLMRANATVMIAHSRTRHLSDLTRQGHLSFRRLESPACHGGHGCAGRRRGRIRSKFSRRQVLSAM